MRSVYLTWAGFFIGVAFTGVALDGAKPWLLCGIPSVVLILVARIDDDQ